VRLATFNILHGRSLEDGRVDLDRFAGAVRELDADVLALQEVDRGQPRSHGADLTAVAAEAGGYVSYQFAAALAGLPGQWRDARSVAGTGEPEYGVALLVRAPVRAWEVVRLPALPGVPILFPGRRRPQVVRDEPRVALVARLDYGLTLMSTHLSFIPWWNRVQLHTLIHRTHPSDRLVLLGDLNLPPDIAVRTTGLHPLASGLTYRADATYEQIDHVLGRGVVAAGGGRAVRLPLSDHCALVAEALFP
jgi:endonuclease/exonuclease/phosphatase family metal-dependent hydrolase